jgi:hypothetical protein
MVTLEAEVIIVTIGTPGNLATVVTIMTKGMLMILVTKLSVQTGNHTDYKNNDNISSKLNSSNRRDTVAVATRKPYKREEH